MESDLHRSLRLKLTTNDNIQTLKFNSALRKHFSSLKKDISELDLPVLMPDAYKIDSTTWTVHCFEVEIRNHINHERVDKYIDLFWELDQFEHQVYLWTIDRYGTCSLLDFVPAVYGQGKFDYQKLKATQLSFSILEKSFDDIKDQLEKFAYILPYHAEAT